MVKNTLYAIATIFLLVSCYFIYGWFKSEPVNKEPLPALLSTIATIILTVIAWRIESTAKENVGSDKAANTLNVNGNNNIVNEGNTNSNIQIHTGTGDNVQGDKKIYNIGKIDKANFS